MRLRDKMRQDLTLRGMSPETIATYVLCARRFAEHFGRSPCGMGASEIRSYLLHLRERGRSASTVNVYAAALRFLYTVTLERPEEMARIPRMRVPMHVPVVLSGTEVEQLLGAFTLQRHRVAAMLAYGAGLHFHPHVHAIVTGGGLADDDARWLRARKDFLFPVRVMGALFRGKMLALLERAHARKHIDLGDVDLRALRSKPWVVYAKRPFGGPEQVLRYLGRYTHRVGISNQRLVAMDERGVTFRTKDGNAVTVDGHEMLARFVQHVLPPRFVKIRHYGLHASSHAKTRLESARESLAPAEATPERAADAEEVLDWRELLLRLSGLDVRTCPACQQRALLRIALPAAHARAPPVAA